MTQQIFVAGLALAIVLGSAPLPTVAKVSPEEAAKLGIEGTELTPHGAIRAGNADGSIPAWEGGIKAPPAGYQQGGWYLDPFADDKVLFTITAQNYQQYADKLSPGQIAMLKKYPDSYKLNVYPTRRSASYPKEIYENSIWNATHTEFCNPPLGPNREERCVRRDVYRPGIFFPIPKTGGEAMWNHTFYWFGKYYIVTHYGFNAFADGTYAEFATRERWILPSGMNVDEVPKGDVFTRNGGAAWCFSQETLAPPRNAGSIFGGCNYFETTDFDAYLYVPGQRRVRKAPEIGFYDSPSTNSDGLRTADSKHMGAMTGDEEWYVWTATRKEMYVPYNSYKMAQPGLTMKDIVRPGHVNSDLVRYELHRVWVIEGKLKPGFRHLSPHRVSYIDEDSWAGVAQDMYDAQDNLWRVSEGYLINYYDVPLVHQFADDHSDLINGRHASNAGWPNISGNPGDLMNFHVMPDPDVQTPAGLRKYGMR